jgi:uncharacterized protein (DUF1501 family)
MDPHVAKTFVSPPRVTRRAILKSAALGASGLTLSALLPRGARAARSIVGSGNPVLVYLFLRGGIDGLSLCVPHGDPDLYAARPKLAIPPPGAIGGALDLDGFFGLNPAAAPLLPAFAAGDLAFVQAFGSPETTRSHFLAFQKVEFGIPGQPLATASEGWLARHLATIPPATPTPLRCAVMHEVVPLSLAGAPNTLPVADPVTIAFPGDAGTAASRDAALRALYAGVGAPLGPAAFDTLDTIAMLEAQSFAPVEHGAIYPDTALGARLRGAAALIKADVGVEAIMLEEDGYDHHAAQGPQDGELAQMLDDLSRSLAAFRQDLAAHWQRVTLLAHSEFGRRVAENASLGTDHGRGGVAIAMGGRVAGGRVLGSWPGLAPAQLVNGDLAVRVDYRDVVSEVLAECLGATNLAVVFPGHVPQFPGLIA